MKEVTEWDNNPREMWVWNKHKDVKYKRFVIYIASRDFCYPVVTRNPENGIIQTCKHCAEIERRRMTNKQLARWLAEKPNREFRNSNNDNAIVGRDYQYYLNQDDDEVPNDVYVREGDGPWHAPFAEVEE